MQEKAWYAGNKVLQQSSSEHDAHRAIARSTHHFVNSTATWWQIASYLKKVVLSVMHTCARQRYCCGEHRSHPHVAHNTDLDMGLLGGGPWPTPLGERTLANWLQPPASPLCAGVRDGLSPPGEAGVATAV